VGGVWNWTKPVFWCETWPLVVYCDQLLAVIFPKCYICYSHLGCTIDLQLERLNHKWKLLLSYSADNWQLPLTHIPHFLKQASIYNPANVDNTAFWQTCNLGLSKYDIFKKISQCDFNWESSKRFNLYGCYCITTELGTGQVAPSTYCEWLRIVTNFTRTMSDFHQLPIPRVHEELIIMKLHDEK